MQTNQIEAGVARIIPALPPAGSTKTYRLQVGSYRLPRNAVDAFEKLKSAGLEPAYEQYGEMYRVVLAGVRADDVQLLAVQLGKAGFSEALVREER
jgi:rare lipoprotein A